MGGRRCGNSIHAVLALTLDITTLFIVILLNSIGFALVWAVISVNYPAVRAARYWLAGLLMTCLSGPLLFLGSQDRLALFAGLTLVATSFTLMWQGIRVFTGYAFSSFAVAGMTVATAASLFGLGKSQEAINIIAAVSQVVPVTLAIVSLMKFRERAAGIYIASAAAAMALAGQGIEALSNMLRLTETMSDATYYRFAPWLLACAVVGGSIWNLGFLLMVTDRLQGELRKLATHDDLTGLVNRRGLREIAIDLERSMRRKKLTAVLMIVDLDNFKSINDRYGHAAGDAALVHVARVMEGVLRKGDYLARWGGDEFCILLPDTNLAQASEMAQRLADAAWSTPLVWDKQLIALSASVGSREWSVDARASLARILDEADRAMFCSKEQGRGSRTINSGKTPDRGAGSLLRFAGLGAGAQALQATERSQTGVSSSAGPAQVNSAKAAGL